MNGRMDGWTDGWMNGRMDERADGWATSLTSNTHICKLHLPPQSNQI